MKPHIYTQENAYYICRHCASVGVCKGTTAFYSCSTWRNSVRSEMSRRKMHQAIMLQPDMERVPELFIKEKNDY